MSEPIQRKKSRTIFPETPKVHIGLFIVTIFTVMFVYLFIWDGGSYSLGSAILNAFIFACSLLAILLCHELGHYLAAKHHGIDATLPFFIPAPIGIGTFGAFIQIKGPIRNRRQLVDVGVAGPFAGAAAAILLAIGGIYRSDFLPIQGADLQLGESLLFKALVLVIKGIPPEGTDLSLSPIAFAAWIGFLVTALNLMPASQLDGGHIVYALFGRGHRIISRAVFLFLTCWGVWGDILKNGWIGAPSAAVITGFGIFLIFNRSERKLWGRILIGLGVFHIAMLVVFELNSDTSMWLFWGILLYMFKLDHPPTFDEKARLMEGLPAPTGLDLKRKLIGVLAILLFIATFMPLPLKILEQ